MGGKLNFLQIIYNVLIQTVIHKNNVHGIKQLKDWIGDRQWIVNVLTYPQNMKAHKKDLRNALINIDENKHRVPIL